MAELNSEECKECHKYSGVYGGLCGNCIVLHDKQPVDYDEGLKLRVAIRAREMAAGTFPIAMVEAAMIEAMDRPKQIVEPGLRKVPTAT